MFLKFLLRAELFKKQNKNKKKILYTGIMFKISYDVQVTFHAVTAGDWLEDIGEVLGTDGLAGPQTQHSVSVID